MSSVRSALVRSLAAVALAAALAPGSVLAKSRPGSPDSTFAKVYLDSERCSVLIAQLTSALVGRAADRGAASARASHGTALCARGKFAEGADTLESAVRMIGEAPVRPRPRVLIR